MAIKMADIVARVTSQSQYSSLLAGDQFGFLSAKQYGAIGDGIADDSAAILTMLSAASASTHLALYFPTGVYKVDNVTLTSTHLSGYYLFGDNASFVGITKDIDQLGQTIGKLSDLDTTNKDSIVDAVNELRSGSFAAYISSGTQGKYLVVASTSAKTLEAKDAPQKVLTNQGDILYASAPNTIGRVGMGTNLQNLSVNATTDGLIYQDSVQKIMTAQGDMIYASSANNPVRLAKGSALQVLTMNGSTTAPQWSASLQSILTTQGDMIYASSANNPVRLAKGTAYQALRMTSDETAPSWGNVMLGEKQIFTSTTTFTAPKTGTYKVTVVGGGGGGGFQGVASGAANPNGGGQGGGAGMSIEYLSLTKGDAVTVTVGTGGTKGVGTAGPNSTETSGGSGVTSSFGSYLSASGGTGGTSVFQGNGAGGNGGTGSSGDLNFDGNPGASGNNSGGYVSYFTGFSAFGSPYGKGGLWNSSGNSGIVVVEW